MSFSSCNQTNNGWGSFASPFVYVGVIALFAGMGTLGAVAAQSVEQGTVQTGEDKVIARSAVSSDPEVRQLRILRQQLKDNPEDLEKTLYVARKFVEKGKKQNNNRFLGYAESVLKHWMEKPETPRDILLLNAQIKEYRHDFTAALTDLEAVNEAAPLDPSARLMRANIYQIQGRYADALEQCRALDPRGALLTEICGLSLKSLSGELETSFAALYKLIDTRPLSLEVGTWALGKLADMAVRRGEWMEALDYYKAMPPKQADTSALRSQLYDVLLEQKEAATVLALVAEDEPADGLVVRRLRAMKMLGMDWRGKQSERLERYFITLESQPENPHAREVAYYHFYLTEDFDHALKAALENWQQQKEPIDTRLVLAAASRAGKRADVKMVVDWVQANRYEDKTIMPYLIAYSN